MICAIIDQSLIKSFGLHNYERALLSLLWLVAMAQICVSRSPNQSWRPLICVRLWLMWLVSMAISFVNEKMAIYAANENIQKLIITIIEICETEKIMFNEMSFLLRRLYVPLCLSLGCTRHLSCDQLWQDTNLFSHDKSNSLQSLIHSWCCEDNRKFCFDSSLYALLVSTSTLNSTFQLATNIELQCFNILDIASDTSSIYKWEFSGHKLLGSN